MIGDGCLATSGATVSSIAEDAALIARFHGTMDAPIESWLEQMRRSPKFALYSDPDDRLTSLDWARARGLVLVSAATSANDARSVAALAQHLRKHVHISDEEFAKLSREVGDEPNAVSTDEWHREVVLDDYTIGALAKCGVLEKAANAFDRVLVAPAALRAMNASEREARILRHSLSLAQRAQQRVGLLREQGRIQEVPSLPDDASERDDPRDVQRSMVESLRQAIEVRRWLDADPRRKAIVADWFIFEPKAQFEAWIATNDRAQTAKDLDVVARTQARVFSMGLFVRLALESTDSAQTLERVARLGFVDAMLPAQFAARLVDARGLSAQGIRALCGDLERQMRPFEFEQPLVGQTVSYHRSRTHTALRLGQLYAQAIATVLRAGAENSSVPLAEELLAHVWKLGEDTKLDAFGVLLQELVGVTSVVPLLPWFNRSAARLQALERSIPLWLAAMRSPGKERASSNLDDLTKLRARPVDGLVRFIDEPLRTVSLVTTSSSTLEQMKLPVASEGRLSIDVSLEELLRRTADAVVAGDATVRLSPTVVFYPVLFEGGAHVDVLASLEAIVLRITTREQRQEWLDAYLRWIGPIDGRVTDATRRWIEEDSDDAKRAWILAVQLGAWRQVLAQPTSVLFWGAGNGVLASVRTIDDLRRMLSEEALPVRTPLALQRVLLDRVGEGGAWSARPERAVLLATAAGSVPGLTGFAAWGAATASDGALITAATIDVESPSNTPIGRLVASLLSLTAAAVQHAVIRVNHSEVDLRAIVATGWAEALRGACSPLGVEAFAPDQRDPSEQTAIVRHEASILRLCSSIVSALGEWQALPMADGLWLSWRLYHWLMAVLRAEPIDEVSIALAELAKVAPSPSSPLPSDRDLWHPAGLHEFEHRAVALLQALLAHRAWSASLEGAATSGQRRWSVALPLDVIALFVQWAGREFTSFEHQRLGRETPNTVFDWVGPETLPELALAAALDQDATSLLRLSVTQRGRWLSVLPRRPGQAGRVSRDVAEVVVMAFADNAKKLSAPELDAFEEFLFECETSDSAVAARWKLHGLARLFAAGRSHLEQWVREGLAALSDRDDAQRLFSRYLLGVTKGAPERLDSAVRELLSRVVPEARVSLVLAPSSLVLEGDEQQVRAGAAWLRRVASDEEFAQNDRVKDVVRRLGLT